MQLEHEPVGIQQLPTAYAPRRSWRTWLFGRPLRTADAPHQTIRKLVGLAVFSSDAMSSVAYGPQEMMLVLSMAGLAALPNAFPIAIGIAALLLILTVSYEQTIHAYPSGGGAYIVSRDNLGERPAEIAGAALLTDYILTVAVSISSGVAQLSSAFPGLYPYRVEIAVALVLFVMIVNLRGVRESGAVFAVPTYFFIVMMFITTIFGMIRFATGTLGIVANPPALDHAHTLGALSIFLVLRAFASGTTALTGVEAISNGIPAFKEPKSHNAGRTLIAMSLVLGSLMLLITFLFVEVRAVPSEFGETMISQLARTVYEGRGLMYLLTIAATTVILIMAANTAFADFPRLSALLAQDGFLPRQLAFRGSRLVFSRGIIALSLLAIMLIVIFQASVTGLIPLYAIGVFLSFTLSQTGMARRWRKSGRLAPDETLREVGSTLRFDPAWRAKMLINGFGAVLTAVVALVFAVTKFTQGAWVVLILIPALVFGLTLIHRHYRRLAQSLSLDDFGGQPIIGRLRVILPISGVHRGTLAALRFAQRLSTDITAVHVSIDPDDTERLRKKWDLWGEGVRLVVLESPYRLFMEPLLEYIEKIDAARQPNDLITVVVPQFVPREPAANLLHTQAGTWLQLALRGRPRVVITEVPYLVK